MKYIPLSLSFALISFSLLVLTFIVDFIYQNHISNTWDMEFSWKIKQLQEQYPLDEEDETGGSYAKDVNRYLEFRRLIERAQPILFGFSVLSCIYYLLRYKIFLSTNERRL